MNNQLIEKIITSNNLSCPEFIYDNPVLDRNVAKALSKSFVKILNLSQQNSKVNNNLRLSILENIRKMCYIEPENHVKINENFTALLLEFYEQIVKDSRTEFESTDKNLDAFISRNLKEMDLNTNYKSPLNPEVVQALININQNGIYLDTLLKDIIYWDCTENKNIWILKDLWTNTNTNAASHTVEDMSIKLKSEIERILLQICHRILNEIDPDVKDIFVSDSFLSNLVRKSSDSANCFQICCGILNYLFIMTNFDIKIQTFVETFVKYVKENCSYTTFSVLYPIHISHITVLLDMEIKALPASLQNEYVKSTKEYLTELGSRSENDLIMLLSHFPQWFDIYFSSCK